MNDEEYKILPRVKRLAIFLLVIGPEQAAPIVKSLEGAHRDAIVDSMSEVGVIDDSMQQNVLQEFSSFLAESLSELRGGKKATLDFFERAMGVEEMEKISSKIGPPKVLQEISSRFEGMKANQIWSALAGEDSQVLAYVLSTLDPRKSVEVLKKMESDQASDVFIRMSQMGSTAADLLPRVAGNVLRSAPKEVTYSKVDLGGAATSAKILKAFDREQSKALLEAVDAVDEDLGKRISKEMFSFKDLVDVSSEAMQRIMREVDSSLLIVAMKSATPELMEKIYSGLSKRGAEALKEEMDMQGNVRASEVEVAQDAVLDVVRRLESEGEIILDEGEDEYV